MYTLLYYATNSTDLCISVSVFFAASASHYNQKTAAIFLLQLTQAFCGAIYYFQTVYTNKLSIHMSTQVNLQLVGHPNEIFSS